MQNFFSLLFFSLLFFAVVLLCGCQKELSLDRSNTRNTTLSDSSELLTKTISIEDGTTATTEFAYDTTRQLTREYYHTTSTSPGAKTYSSHTIYTYDAQGRVFRIAHKENQTIENVLYDTSYAFVHYINGASDEISYTKRISVGNGKTFFDSVLYTYSNAHSIIKTEHYAYAAGQPVPSQPNIYYTWDYSAKGNLIERREYIPDTLSASYKLNFTYKFGYDDKVNPLAISKVRLEKHWGAAVSPNNEITQTNFYPGGQLELLTTTYQYRADGRPISAKFSGGGRTVTRAYTYQ